MRKILFILLLLVSLVSYGQSVKSDSTVVYEYHFKIDTKKKQKTELELEIERLEKMVEHLSNMEKLRNDMRQYEGHKEYQKLNEDFKRLEKKEEELFKMN